MINCPSCTHFDGERCDRFGRQPSMAVCHYAEERKPRNRFERFKAMSPEELAAYIDEHTAEAIMFFSYAKAAKERCDGCRDCRTVRANGGWSFRGCYHEPYHGKWVGEIRNCPIYHEAEEGEWTEENTCSHCGEEACAGYDEEPWLTRYRPHCGAKMKNPEEYE